MMATFLDQVRMWAEGIIRTGGYPGITLLMFVEGIFPPLPSEVVMTLAGSLVARGELSYGGVLLAGTAGSLLVALVLYYAGRVVGDAGTVQKAIRQHGRWFLLSERDWDRALHGLERYGAVLVLAGRLIPTIRSLISIPAGLRGMKLREFMLLTTLGTLLWNAILTSAGVALGRNWERVLGLVAEYERWVWIGIGLAILGAATRYVLARQR